MWLSIVVDTAVNINQVFFFHQEEQVMEAEVVWPAPAAQHVKIHILGFWAQRGHTGNIRHTKHTMGTPEIMYIAQLTLGTLGPKQSGSCPSVSRYTALQLERIKATCSTVDRQKQTHIYAKTHKHTLYYILNMKSWCTPGSSPTKKCKQICTLYICRS